MHRPCRCFGSSETTIHRACWCLEASQVVPGSHQKHPKSRSIGPVGGQEAHKPRSIVLGGVWRPPKSAREAITYILSHDPSALSVSGSLTRHKPQCLFMFGAHPEFPKWFLEAIRNIPSRDPSALSVSGSFTRHNPPCLSLFGAPQITPMS